MAHVGCGNGLDLRQIVPQGRCRHASIREPLLAWVGEPLDFDAVLADIAVKVEQLVQAHGSFRTTSHAGVFICR